MSIDGPHAPSQRLNYGAAEVSCFAAIFRTY